METDGIKNDIMIEDEIEQAKPKLDIIDASVLSDFVKDVETGNLVFYRDKEGVFYFNLKSADYGKERLGEEGKKYFKMMNKEIKKNKAEKLNDAEIQELLRKMQAEKNERDQYFG